MMRGRSIPPHRLAPSAFCAWAQPWPGPVFEVVKDGEAALPRAVRLPLLSPVRFLGRRELLATVAGRAFPAAGVTVLLPSNYPRGGFINVRMHRP